MLLQFDISFLSIHCFLQLILLSDISNCLDICILHIFIHNSVPVSQSHSVAAVCWGKALNCWNEISESFVKFCCNP